MDEASILSKFDDLVQSGMVQYDPKQETIRHGDGELEFNFLLTAALIKKPTIQPLTAQNNNSKELNSDSIEGSDMSQRPHLMLLTTNGCRRQYEALDEDDMAANRKILSSMTQEYIAFFNCGRDGGCSRLHKHMQLIPKPPHSFADFLDADDDVTRPTNVPFQWFYQRLDIDANTAELTRIYIGLLQQATAAAQGQSEHADSAPANAACPHNLIISQRWMIVIPRRRAGINKEAGANALGMLGVIAVATRPEMDNWFRLGLTESLRALGVPR